MSFTDPRIAYAAHTATCTFLLDEEGICVDIVAAPGARKDPRTGNTAQCLGAQYVASLDLASSGGLVELPSPGSTMLFARVDERGRVSLVRTGVVTEFESRRDADPFDGRPSADSGAVWTSAPEIPQREEAPAPRVKRTARPAQAARAAANERSYPDDRRSARRAEPLDEERPEPDFGLDYDDDNARTRVIEALRPEEVLPLTRRRDEQPMPLVTRRAIRRSQPSAGDSQPIRREATRETLRDPGREVSAGRQAQPRGMLPKRAPQFVPNEPPAAPPPQAQVQSPPKRDNASASRAVPWPSSRAGGRAGASHPSSFPPDADVRVAGRRRDR